MNDTITIKSITEDMIKSKELPREDISDFADSLRDGSYKSAVNYGTILTDNGKPSVLVVDISDYDTAMVKKEMIRFMGLLAMNHMRSEAEKRGWMTEEEIEEEIAAARREKRAREAAAKNAGSN